MRYILIFIVLSACAPTAPSPVIETAYKYFGLHEKYNKKELYELIRHDPEVFEWCALFVNEILYLNGIEGSETVANNPLMARSFLEWGEKVDHKKIRHGDVVIFPRGKPWQGHVGFYVGNEMKGDVLYYKILGGNQNDRVGIDLYKASRAIAIRRQNTY